MASVTSPHALAACFALTLVACGGAAPPPTTVIRTTIPDSVSDASYPEAARTFHRLPFDHPDRVPLRAQLVGVLAQRTARLSELDDYQAVLDLLFEFTQLYTPAELDAGPVAPQVGEVARLVIERGSPRGDEGPVLSALLVLRTLNPQDPSYAEAYDQLVQWGRQSRAGLSGLGPLENYEGLITAWESHVRLTPTDKTMQFLAQLYVERRDALIALFQQSEHQLPLSSAVFQGVQRTVLDVAAVFLARADLTAAHRAVLQSATGNSLERRLAEAIEMAKELNTTGAGAALDLARNYLEGGRSDVAQGLCRYGLRQMPQDPRFHQCLARIAAVSNDHPAALAWYAEAVALAPDERPLYDEILEVLANLIAQGLTSDDPAQNRRMGARAIEILEQRTARWPDQPTPVSPADLYRAIGVSEMNAGYAVEAEARLRQSLAAESSTDTLMQLGLLLGRTGHGDDALGVYQRALDQTPAQNPLRTRLRAEILEQMGDVQRLLGRQETAANSYRQALELWSAILPMLNAANGGPAQVRRGVLMDRLGRHADALTAFNQAMTLAPASREVYATILAYLVSAGTDRDLANHVFRRAQVQLDLPPEWKVYFALWVRANAARQGQPGDADADQVLAGLSSGEGWWGRLSRFGSGNLSYAQLLQEATTLGERTEAHFYEAMRLLAAGDEQRAQALLRQVLESQMVNFYEYTMAHELLSSATSTTSATSATSTTSTTSTTATTAITAAPTTTATVATP